jgi:hypothetical protein
MRIVMALMGLLVVAPAQAWGPLGHRISGVIAQQHLTPAAQSAVEQILGTEDLAEASTWADDMRSSPELFWQKTASPFHYVTIPDGKAYGDVGAPAEGDAVTALKQFAATLRDPRASRPDKALALRFTVHLVADLQQPLHAGNGLDHGGNDLKVSWFERSTNLHAVWDSALLDQKGLSFTEYAIWLQRRMTPAQARDWAVVDPMVWVGESAALRNAVYPKEPKLGFNYAFEMQPLAEQRITQAGLRLAAYLNQLFAGGLSR